FAQDAIDAVADDDVAFARLDVDVAGGGLNTVFNDQVDGLGDGRIFGDFVLFADVFFGNNFSQLAANVIAAVLVEGALQQCSGRDVDFNGRAELFAQE